MQERILKILSSNAIQISSDSLSRALFADEWRDTSKEIADTFKRFAEWCIVNEVKSSPDNVYYAVDDFGGTFDELFKYWSEVIDKK